MKSNLPESESNTRTPRSHRLLDRHESDLDGRWDLQDVTTPLGDEAPSRRPSRESAARLTDAALENHTKTEAALDCHWQEADLEAVPTRKVGSSRPDSDKTRVPHIDEPRPFPNARHEFATDPIDEDDPPLEDDIHVSLEHILEAEDNDVDDLVAPTVEEPEDDPSVFDHDDASWGDIAILDSNSNMDSTSPALPDIDAVFDFSLLDDFDAEARVPSESVAVESVSDLQSRQRLARALAQRNGWNSPDEMAVLEEIVRPLKKVGRSLHEVQQLIERGITPDELTQAYQLKQILEGYATLITWESRPKYMKQKLIHHRITWWEAWQLSLAFGPEMDPEETVWLLDRLHSEWYSRIARRYAGFSEAFSIPDSFRAFLLARFIRTTSDIPFWALENLCILVDPNGEPGPRDVEGSFDDGVWL